MPHKPQPPTKSRFDRVFRSLAAVWAFGSLAIAVTRPILPEPLRTYAGHAMYAVFFGGIIAFAIFVKIWIAPYMPDRSAERRDSSEQQVKQPRNSNLTIMLFWNAVFLVVAVALLLTLKYFGIVLDTRVLYVCVLVLPLAVTALYHAGRYLLRR